MSYLQGGGFVTEQGRRAVEEQKARVEELTVTMLTELRATGGVPVKDLFSHFSPHREADIRAALWDLMDDKLITVNVERLAVPTS